MVDDLVKRLRVNRSTLQMWLGEHLLEQYEKERTEAAIRIEKLEAALRLIAGPSTVEFVDGTYEISETKMLSTYRRRAKKTLNAK